MDVLFFSVGILPMKTKVSPGIFIRDGIVFGEEKIEKFMKASKQARKIANQYDKKSNYV